MNNKNKSNDLSAVLENSLKETLVSEMLVNVVTDEEYRERIQETLRIKGITLSSMSESDLSARMYDLAQYTAYLQTYCNGLKIHYLQAKRKFEFELARACSTLTLGSKATMKEKEAAAVLGSPKLQLLEKDYNEKEAEFILYDKIPDSVSEIINALKKELSIREK